MLNSVLTLQSIGMEGARDTAEQVKLERGGVISTSSPTRTIRSRFSPWHRPEIWRDTEGKDHAFRYDDVSPPYRHHGRVVIPEEKNLIRIIGVQPADGRRARHPQIGRRAYLPKIFENARAWIAFWKLRSRGAEMARWLARRRAYSRGFPRAAVWPRRSDRGGEPGARIVHVCDRGDRYPSTGCSRPGWHYRKRRICGYDSPMKEQALSHSSFAAWLWRVRIQSRGASDGQAAERVLDEITGSAPNPPQSTARHTKPAPENGSPMRRLPISR